MIISTLKDLPLHSLIISLSKGALAGLMMVSKCGHPISLLATTTGTRTIYDSVSIGDLGFVFNRS